MSSKVCHTALLAVRTITWALALFLPAIGQVRHVEILSPPGVTNNASSFEVAVVPSTGLIYNAGSAFGRDIGVINPATASLVANVPLSPANGFTGEFTFQYSRVNPSTSLVYFGTTSTMTIVVVDGRSGSPTFNQTLPGLTFAGTSIGSFAIDHVRNRMYVGVRQTATQSNIAVVDTDPNSPTFHQVLSTVTLPATETVASVVVNTVSNKIYASTSQAGGGVFVMDGVGLSPTKIAGTMASAGIIVNSTSNTVYALRFSTAQVQAIDGITDSLMTTIGTVGANNNIIGDNMAVNLTTERVYLVFSTNATLQVLDAKRSSPTFNTIIAAPQNVGSGEIAIDESQNKIVVTATIGSAVQFPGFQTSVVDGATNTVQYVSLGNIAPSHLTVDESRDRAVIAYQLHNTQIIDLASSVVTTIPTAAEVSSGVVNPNNGHYLASAFIDEDQLGFLDTNDDLGLITGQAHNMGRTLFSAINAATNRAYFVNTGSNALGTNISPGSVVVVDGATNSVITSINVGPQPFNNPGINEATNKIYVMNVGFAAVPSSISVIDGISHAVSTVNTSAFPVNHIFTGFTVPNPLTNKIYFTASGLAGVINGATDVATPISGITTAGGVDVNPGLNRAYFRTATNLFVLDGTNDTQIANIPLSAASSFWVNRVTGRIFVLSSANETLTAINGLTNTVIGTIPVGNRGVITVDEVQDLIIVGDTTNPDDESTSSLTFIDGTTLTVRGTLQIPLVPGHLAVNPNSRVVYAGTTGAAQRTGIVVVDYNQFAGCVATQINIGQSVVDGIDNFSCNIGPNETDLYTFSGNAGQEIAITMETAAFFSKIELLNPSGQVIQTAGGVNGVNNSRVPANGYFTLPATGTYTIRAIGAFGGTGGYTLSLYEAPVQTCTYSISPASVDVPAGGGSFSFDVMTQPGCPPAATPPVSGTIYNNLTYTGGRVRFNVISNPGSFRSEMISIGGGTFTINQCGTGPPGNDHFANAAVINGPSGMHNEIISNSVATAEAGEPSHAGNTAVKSVWYSWTAPANGLYSFSTSGSDFNTVMAVYACPTSGNCTFASMTQVVSNDDTTFYDVTSKVNFRADLGRTYKIAVDGKNGASGNVELSWRQYQRLFRLYLQTYNGTQSPIVPDSISASNGTNTVTPLLVSLGVYEFNLPADNTVYTVTITGPTGIVWDPNGFPLDTSFTSLDELMQGLTGQQNTVSNAAFQFPQSIFGFIKNITPQEVPDLSVILASSRGPNPRPPVDCTEIVAVLEPPGQYVRYRCTSYPNTLHDIIPRMTGKAFALPVRSFEAPISGTVLATTSTAMIASSATTYTLAGNVTSGGSGVQVDLRYTPVAGAPEVTLRTSTNSAGAYSFGNLPAGTFQLTARRMGLVFGPAQQVTLPGGGGPVNITPQTVCTYAPAGLSTTAFAGGPAQFSVAVNDPACEWLATTTAPWIVINSGATVGNGPVHYTLQNNAGIARAGIIMVGDQPVQIQQEGEIPPSGIEGDLSPRGGPDGAVLSNDVIQLRRFVTGLDTLNGAVNEGQRADIAPRSSLGDGALASSDVVQARRYVTGLDPQTNAGGPAIALSSVPNPLREMPSDDRPSTRQVRFGRIEEVSFGSITVPVEIVGFGNEPALSFTVEYDPSVLASPKIELADAAYGVVLTVNAKEKGRIGILIDSAVPIAPAAAARIINLTFDVAAANAGDAQLHFTDSIVRREVSDETAAALKTRFHGTTSIFGVTGRIRRQ